VVKILQASLSDIPAIRSIAEETWWPTYTPIISADQIRYMLNAIYSAETLQKVIEDGSQVFLILSDETGPQGFAAFGQKPGNPAICKLHKLYVLPENRGKGYGKMLIAAVKDRIATLQAHTLDLNVNRYNDPARVFYEKAGFKVVGEEDIPVGPYLMNDYVMRLDLNNS
jgi:diamine N-acetyltransferase